MKRELNLQVIGKEVGWWRLFLMGALFSTLVTMLANTYNRLRRGLFKQD